MEVRGSLGCPPVVYPKLIEMVRLGPIRVNELVTQRFPLDEINAVFYLLYTVGRGDLLVLWVRPPRMNPVQINGLIAFHCK